MPSSRAFYVIFKDDDKKEFNILGPMSDDTQITDKTVAAQKAGQNVNVDIQPIDKLIKMVSVHGYSYTKTSLL